MVRVIDNSLGEFIFLNGFIKNTSEYRQITYSRLIMDDSWNIFIENDKGRVYRNSKELDETYIKEHLEQWMDKLSDEKNPM